MPDHPHPKYRYNRLLNWKVGQMTKTGVISKILHADPEISQMFGSTLDTDISPFMIYSLNKHKRWEITINQGFLEELQLLNMKLEVMFFQRVSVTAWTDNYAMFPPSFYGTVQCSKIRKSAEISKDGKYLEQNFGGVGKYYGPSILETKKVDRAPTTMEVVSYNIVQDPKNWQKVFTKDFRNWSWNRHSPTYLKKSQLDPKCVKWDLMEYYDDNEGYYVVELEEDFSCDYLTSARKEYNFMNHIVEKKTRKSRKINDVNEFVWL